MHEKQPGDERHHQQLFGELALEIFDSPVDQ